MLKLSLVWTLQAWLVVFVGYQTRCRLQGWRVSGGAAGVPADESRLRGRTGDGAEAVRGPQQRAAFGQQPTLYGAGKHKGTSSRHKRQHALFYQRGMMMKVLRIGLVFLRWRQRHTHSVQPEIIQRSIATATRKIAARLKGSWLLFLSTSPWGRLIIEDLNARLCYKTYKEFLDVSDIKKAVLL